MTATAAHLVWSGRLAGEEGAGASDWSTSREGLHEALATVSGLVVRDPLSFPWQELDAPARLLPVVVALPAELDAATLSELLGAPVLAHLTPADTLVEPRPEVREALTASWDLPPAVWADALPGDLPEDLDATLRAAGAAKAVHAHLDAVVGEQLRAAVAGAAGAGTAEPRVRAVGEARWRAHALARSGGSPVSTDPADPAPDVVVAALPDGAPGPERRAALREVRDLLHPGGRAVVSAYVVDRPGGPANARLSDLVEDLWQAFGTMVQVDDVRSTRLPGELLSRVVVLTVTSLWPRPL